MTVLNENSTENNTYNYRMCFHSKVEIDKKIFIVDMFSTDSLSSRRTFESIFVTYMYIK